MARGINKVILIGNLGADPEVRYTPSGMAIAKLRLATTERRKDRETGDWQDHTEWHRVTLFGRLGEVAGEYLRKGSKVYIEGSLRTTKWQGQDGQDRYTTEIVANDMQMLDSRGGGDAAFNERPARQAPPQSALAPAPAQPAASSPPPDDFDDDIPF